jgi:hypothetical protein
MRSDMPPAMIEHCFVAAGLPGSLKVELYTGGCSLMNAHQVSAVEAVGVTKIVKALRVGEELIERVCSGPLGTGYIFLQTLTPSIATANEPTATTETRDDDEDSSAYIDFQPFLYAQYESTATPLKSFTSYNVAVDTYFSSIESQKHKLKAIAMESQALKKIEAIRNVGFYSGVHSADDCILGAGGTRQ